MSSDKYREQQLRKHMKIDDIDFIRRTLTCATADLSPKQSTATEAFEKEQSEEQSEEQSLELPEEETICYSDLSTSEYTRAQRLWDELECVKRQIQLLQIAVKRQRGAEQSGIKNVTETNVASDSEREPNQSVCDASIGHLDHEISLLKKDQHKMQQQLTELLRSLQGIRKVLREMRIQSCCRLKELRNMELSVDELSNWKNEVSKDVGACDKRYHYIMEHKSTTEICHNMLKTQMRNAQKLIEKFVRKSDFNFHISKLNKKLKMISTCFVEFEEDFLKNLQNLEIFIEKLTSEFIELEESDQIKEYLTRNISDERLDNMSIDFSAVQSSETSANSNSIHEEMNIEK